MDNNRNLPYNTYIQFKETLKQLLDSKSGPKAIQFLSLLVLLVLGFNALNVYNSYIGRDFISSIEKGDRNQFQYYALVYSAIFVVSSGIGAIYRFLEERLGILWREQLTWKLTKNYLRHKAYHQLNLSIGVENPDQRITEDVKSFTTTTLSFVLLLLGSLVTTIAFSGILWSINPILLLVALLYALLGSFIAIKLGNPLIQLNYHQLDLEATFRADLVHIRENAEAIAISHRESRFNSRLNFKLKRLTNNFKKLIRVNLKLGFFANNYNYFIQIIPALIIAPAYMNHEVEFGVITQSAMAFTTLLGAFSLIVTQFQSISSFSAVVTRLHLLSESIDKLENNHITQPSVNIVSDLVKYKNINLKSNDQNEILLKNLNLEIRKGETYLIHSKSEISLVALFRATAGLWDYNGGKIFRPDLENIYFLPERPYLPPGPLRRTLISFEDEIAKTDEQIISIISALGLDSIVIRSGGLRSELDWNDELSLKEQYLFSIARILIASPTFIFMDRPSTSLSESEIYKILEIFQNYNITPIVFSNDALNKKYFTHQLSILKNGKWKINSIGKRNNQPKFK
jgi:putative ATP-binding cassette transporter